MAFSYIAFIQLSWISCFLHFLPTPVFAVSFQKCSSVLSFKFYQHPGSFLNPFKLLLFPFWIYILQLHIE